MMSTRSENLAKRLRQGAQELVAFIEGCSDAEWQAQVGNEERAVGTLIHHVASAYPGEIGIVNILIKGDGLSGVTWDMVDEGNAEHAENARSPSKEETLELLNKNSEAAATTISELSDEQLDTVGSISLNNNTPLSTQFFIEEHPIAHPYLHLASIKAVLGK
jgi:uncharacterized damage-inducible protein DinB